MVGFNEYKKISLLTNNFLKVIPVIKYVNGESQNDSTFIFEKLDLMYTSRPIIPKDPKTAFLALLLEVSCMLL